MKESKMFCKLKNAVITPDYDFLPEGLEVQVLCWSEEKSGFLLVRASSYVYVDGEPKNMDDWDGNVSMGLYVDVDPNNLIYSGGSVK